MSDCTLVTSEWIPALDPDDRLLMAELQRRGLSVGIAVWSDPKVNWAASGLCVLRSTWDYHGRYDEFVAWLERVTAATAMRNQARLVRWNAHKSYLRELQWCGVPVVPTEWVQRGEPRSLAEICAERGWGDAVLKPARGAAAHQVTHVRRDNVSLAAGDAALTELLQRHDALVQPYLGSVAGYGERGLIFFEDRYSHAVAKKPFDSVLAVGNARSSAITPRPRKRLKWHRAPLRRCLARRYTRASICCAMTPATSA